MNCCRKEPDDAQEQLKRSRAIDRVLEEDRIRIRRKVRMLLLGPGESGKSTILKQMKIIYQNGYTEQERVAFRFPVYRCILDSVKLLIEAMRRFEIALENPENRQHCDLIMDAEIGSDPEKACLNAGVTEAIESFWRDPCIPKVLERSNQFYLYVPRLQIVSTTFYLLSVHLSRSQAHAHSWPAPTRRRTLSTIFKGFRRPTTFPQKATYCERDLGPQAWQQRPFLRMVCNSK